MITIFFLYGLAFFSLGVAITVYPRKDSAFRLADKLWLIAGFGIVHGVHEWIEMFILMNKPAEAGLLDLFSIVSLVISFLFLIYFGTIIISEKKKIGSVFKALPFILFIGWAALAIINSRQLLLMSICARYLMGAPGVFLAAYALYLQIPELKKENLSTITANLKIAIGVLLCYGLFAALIVPKADFFPASVLNYPAFLRITGIPIQIFRSICAIIFAYTIIRVLNMFELEKKAKIKKLTEMKDSLTQMIVHDLNGPLLGVSANLQLLDMELSQQFSSEQRKEFNSAMVATGEMKQMISNILDISKMEEDKLNLIKEKIVLNSLFKEAIDVMAAAAQVENKKLSFSISTDMPLLFIDKEIIRRVILNLIGNALKFAPENSEVCLSAVYSPKDKQAVVGVKDEGEGIPKDYLGRVFEKFVQVESSKQKRHGKGLGLTFCKMAVEAHGGRIWIESELGKGSTFFFTIPIE